MTDILLSYKLNSIFSAYYFTMHLPTPAVLLFSCGNSMPTGLACAYMETQKLDAILCEL